MERLKQYAKDVWNVITTPDNIFITIVLGFLLLIIIGC